MKSLPFLLPLLSLLLIPLPVSAQGGAEDYERAAGLQKRFSDKVFRDSVEPHWFDGNERFWYQVTTGPGTKEFILVDPVEKTRGPAFDHQKLAEALSRHLKSEVDPWRLPFDKITFDPQQADTIWIPADGGLNFNTASGELAASGPPDSVGNAPASQPDSGPRRPGRGVRRNWEQDRSKTSPDSLWQVRVEKHNLVLASTVDRAEHPLTIDGTESHPYLDGIVWAPDSKHFVAFRKKNVEERIVYTIESSPRDGIQPKLHKNGYAKPGDELSVAMPHLFRVAEAVEIPVKRNLFENPWSISQLRWDRDGSRFTFLYNQRGHQVLRMVAVDAGTGAATSLIDESPDTFVCYSSKSFIHHLDGSNEMIWSSERDGWHHLYLYDFRTGKLKNQITSGSWVVRDIERIDAETRTIHFTAGGIHEGQDPYHLHHARIGFDGNHLTVLTEGDGTHQIRYSPNGKYLLDRYSRVDLPPIHELRDAGTGEFICLLEEADADALNNDQWQTPERFVAKGRDGVTDIYGVIHRPTNFDPEKKYPVIESIYAGPHSAFVPKSFDVHSKRRELAELGFIIVQIDGMGTSHRSKAFHDVCWKNLGDSGFPDRILWIKAAAEKHPSMDLSRVGIYGGSAGGQSSTRAMLAHGEFYKAAVSDCGCHDNRMDKIWWNEQWMGWPLGEHYHEQSNVTQAHRLTGKLLLIVGELDTNVDPASTMQVVDALIRADRDFDLLVVPGAGHGVAESPYGTRRRRDFFVRHLLGVEPRWQH